MIIKYNPSLEVKTYATIFMIIKYNPYLEIKHVCIHNLVLLATGLPVGGGRLIVECCHLIDVG